MYYLKKMDKSRSWVFFSFQKNKAASSKEPKIITKQSIVPDFDKSYQKFLKNLQQKKMSKPTTVIQPFSFDDDIDVSFETVTKSFDF